jgi:hypothetical protein
LVDLVGVDRAEGGEALVDLLDAALHLAEAGGQRLGRWGRSGLGLGRALCLDLGLHLGEDGSRLLGVDDRLRVARHPGLLPASRHLRAPDRGLAVSVAHIGGGGLDLVPLRRRPSGAGRQLGQLLRQAALPLDGVIELRGERIDRQDPAGRVRVGSRRRAPGSLDLLGGGGPRRLGPSLSLARRGPARLDVGQRSLGGRALAGQLVTADRRELGGRHHRPALVGIDVEQRQHLLGEVEEHPVGFEQPRRTADPAPGEVDDGLDQLAASLIAEPGHHRHVRVEVDELVRADGELQQSQARRP